MEDVLFQGWGTKLGGFFKTWRRRWFVLTKSKISYYKSPDGKLCGEIFLEKITEVAPFPDCIKQPAFKIVIPNVRTYQVYTDTEQEVLDSIGIEMPIHAER